jgi:hypothetical protein
MAAAAAAAVDGVFIHHDGARHKCVCVGVAANIPPTSDVATPHSVHDSQPFASPPQNVLRNGSCCCTKTHIVLKVPRGTSRHSPSHVL